MYALLATFIIGGCSSDNNGPLAANGPNAPTVGNVPTVDSQPQVDSSPPAVPQATPVSYTGLPFGPFGLWNIAAVNWGPAPFTGSHNYINADGIIQQIAAARALGQRLVLAMSGGLSSAFVTNGQFDMTKWTRRMDSYNTDAIKKAVAEGVADGTIIGNTLIDEPETKQWGTNLTKAMIDAMAAYVKNIFPSLSVGVNHGPPAYSRWRTSEHYHVVDYVLYQYAHFVTLGDVGKWRDAVLAQARSEGATPALSLNILNGGAQDRDGTWDCTGDGQAGRGTREPNCRMTPTQLRSWGAALAPYGCFLTMWRYDGAYMSEPANKEAFTEIASAVASQPARTCKRTS